jgi:NDP-sugar pyrophosphorylase family protein
MREKMPPIFILAGGLGSRLGQLGKEKPKAMMTVAGEPFIAHQLQLLRRHGFEVAVICTGHLGEQIESLVGDGSAFDITVFYSRDSGTGDLLGTGGALKRAVTIFPIAGDVALTYGDSYLDIPYLPIYQAFLGSGQDALMTVLRNKNKWGRSNIRINQGLIELYDKSALDEKLDYIDFGLTFLKRSVFEAITAEIFDLSLLWQNLIVCKQLTAYEVCNRFYEIGTPHGLRETESFILEQQAKARR